MSVSEAAGFRVESTSKLELWVINSVCEPLVRRIPRSIHPNTITFGTLTFAGLLGGLGYLSVGLEPLGRTLCLLGASFAMAGVMIGDCLDGMHARRTNRCSSLGALLDHWFDAVNVPMVTFGLVAALQLAPWLMAAIHITNAMIYNSQLVLYHRSGTFVNADASGVDANFGVSVGFVGLAVFLLVVDRGAPWVEWLFTGLGVVAVLMQLKLNGFFYVRLKAQVVHTLPFVLLCGVFAALYLTHAIDLLAFLTTITLVSFRITGRLVLCTIVKQPFNGFDVGIAMWAIVIGGVHFFMEPISIARIAVGPLLPYLACTYMAGRNLLDLRRHHADLRGTS